MRPPCLPPALTPPRRNAEADVLRRAVHDAVMCTHLHPQAVDAATIQAAAVGMLAKAGAFPSGQCCRHAVSSMPTSCRALTGAGVPRSPAHFFRLPFPHSAAAAANQACQSRRWMRHGSWWPTCSSWPALLRCCGGCRWEEWRAAASRRSAGMSVLFGRVCNWQACQPCLSPVSAPGSNHTGAAGHCGCAGDAASRERQR